MKNQRRNGSEVYKSPKIRYGRIRVSSATALFYGAEQIRKALVEGAELDRTESPSENGRYLASLDYFLIHPEFDEIDQDASAPFYDCLFTKESDGSVTRGPMSRLPDKKD